MVIPTIAPSVAVPDIARAQAVTFRMAVAMRLIRVGGGRRRRGGGMYGLTSMGGGPFK